jgi:hypothetical protein
MVCIYCGLRGRNSFFNVRVLHSVLLRRVVWQKFTNDSEERSVSIFKVEK